MKKKHFNFEIRKKNSLDGIASVELLNGSILSMEGNVQRFFQHQLPETTLLPKLTRAGRVPIGETDKVKFRNQVMDEKKLPKKSVEI